MTTTANLALPLLEAGQAQKHVTVNEALARLDALVQLSVVSATTAAEPGAPAEGADESAPGRAAWQVLSMVSPFLEGDARKLIDRLGRDYH